MKVQIIIAAICLLGVASASSTTKREESAAAAPAKQNVFAEWQKTFQQTLESLLKNNGAAQKPKRETHDDAVNGTAPVKHGWGWGWTTGVKNFFGNFFGGKKNKTVTIDANKLVKTTPLDNVHVKRETVKPKYNIFKNPVLKNPNWNKKPETSAAAAVEEVDTVTEISA